MQKVARALVTLAALAVVVATGLGAMSQADAAEVMAPLLAGWLALEADVADPGYLRPPRGRIVPLRGPWRGER